MLYNPSKTSFLRKILIKNDCGKLCTNIFCFLLFSDYVFMELIVNIKYNNSLIWKVSPCIRECKKILSSNLLEFFKTYNVSVNDVYMEVIANIKCQIHHLHLEKGLIQKIQEKNSQHLC